MKTSSDPRHKQRIKRVQALFASSFHEPGSSELISPILSELDRYDRIIAQAAPEWPLAKINRIDLSILRVATYELLATDTPEKVVIDEAVEIAKTYGSESSPSFVNGVLGTILEEKSKTHDH